MKKNKLLYLVCACSFLFSCSKNNSTPPVLTDTASGVYVLNQGNYGHNNTMLSFYNFSGAVQTTDIFRTVNGFGLGDSGSDFIVYGRKIYIIMNVSGYVCVADSYTASFIDTIDFKNAGVNRGPQNIVAYGNKVFVSSNDGTVAVIDTATLAVSKYVTVGSNPAQMAVSGTNLYVSNTGAISGNYDSTVSVVDLGSLTETGKITVGLNPGSIATDDSHKLYVVCTGNYDNVAPSLVKVDLTDNSVELSVDSAYGSIRYFNNALYTTGGYLGAASVGIINTSDLTAFRSSFITDGTTIVNPYGIDIDAARGYVYVTDAKDYSSSGEVFCFDQAGEKKFSFSTTPGINPMRAQVVLKYY